MPCYWLPGGGGGVRLPTAKPLTHADTFPKEESSDHPRQDIP